MDIMDLMKKYGVEIPSENVDAFNKDFRASYKSAAEHKKVKDDLTAAQGKLDTAADFEGKYNTLFRKYETDIAAKQAEIDGLAFDIKLDKALAGVEFVNGRVRDSVISEIRGKNFSVSDTGEIEGLSDYLKELRTNEPDIFKTKGAGSNTWSGGSSGVDKPDIDSKANIFGKLL